MEAVPVTTGVGAVAGALEAVVWAASHALARGTVSAEEEVVWPASRALARGAVSPDASVLARGAVPATASHALARGAVPATATWRCLT